jgi:hypothetical protein
MATVAPKRARTYQRQGCCSIHRPSAFDKIQDLGDKIYEQGEILSVFFPKIFYKISKKNNTPFNKIILLSM